MLWSAHTVSVTSKMRAGKLERFWDRPMDRISSPPPHSNLHSGIGKGLKPFLSIALNHLLPYSFGGEDAVESILGILRDKGMGGMGVL